MLTVIFQLRFPKVLYLEVQKCIHNSFIYIIVGFIYFIWTSFLPSANNYSGTFQKQAFIYIECKFYFQSFLIRKEEKQADYYEL